MKRTIAIAGIYILVIAGVLLAVSLGLQKPETSIVQDVGVLTQVTAEVNKYITIKIVSADKNVSIYVPPDAIGNDGYLVLTSLEPNLLSNSNDGWERPVVVNLDLYDLSGKLIANPMIQSTLDICFSLSDQEKIKFNENRENYFIQYYEDKQFIKKWMPINYSTRSDKNQRCGEITHLTLFSLAIKRAIPIFNPSNQVYQYPPK